MSRKKLPDREREFDFALIVGGVGELSRKVEDALFSAGCDDATLSMRHGRLYVEFSRSARSIEQAILGAIHQVRSAGIGAEVLRVDECNLVTPSEIARRIGRSRQLVSQYMNGTRGPGAFPPPEFYLADGAPLWEWRAVTQWLADNDVLRPEESWNAEVIAVINNRLEARRYHERNPELTKAISKELKSAG